MKLGIPLEDYTFEVKEIIESATEKWAIPETLHKYKLHDLKTAFDILNKTGQQYQKAKMILNILKIRKCAELIKNRPLVAEEGYYPDYRSYICSPDFNIESLELALKELEKENKEPETKICPYCLTEIKYHATRCPNCTSELVDENAKV